MPRATLRINPNPTAVHLFTGEVGSLCLCGPARGHLTGAISVEAASGILCKDLVPAGLCA